MGDQAAFGKSLNPARRLGALSVLIGILVPLGASCAREVPEGRPAAACSLPPEIEIPAGIPDDFPWPPDVTVTQAEPTKRFVAITGFGDQTVEQLFEIMRAELTDKEFDIINTDYEGFEAELYFAKGDSLAGIASLREDSCDGYVQVHVVYDPLETAAGREAVRKTRRASGEGPDN